MYVCTYMQYIHAVTCSCLLQSPKFHDSSWYTIFQHSACVPCLSGPSDVTQMFLSGKKSRAWLKSPRKNTFFLTGPALLENPTKDGLSSIWTRQDHHDTADEQFIPGPGMYATPWIIGTQNRQSYESLIEKVQTSLCPHEFYPFWKTGHSPLKTVADIRPTSW